MRIDFSKFLDESRYVDFSSLIIRRKAESLFRGANNDIEKIKIAYSYVRDEITHSFDVKSKVITAKASDVLKFRTGICHAKANLLAALLRLQAIPAGFCFQHITLADDDSAGYCIHCLNAVFLDGRWIKLDARGNKPGVNAQFSIDTPILAFPNRKHYDEYFWNGIYSQPHADIMNLLENAKSLRDILDNIPDYLNEPPDIMTEENDF